MRGYQKRVIFLKNLGSDIFEEAYFIVKEEKAACSSDGDIIKEAERVIRENSKCGVHASASKFFKMFLPFGVGFFTAGIFFTAALLIIL